MGNSETKMIDEISLAGYTFKDVNDIYKHSLEPKLVEIILKWLPAVYKDHIGSSEHLTRSLISAKEPFDPSVLIGLFENNNYNKTLKWTMAYVLAISKTYDITDFIRSQLLDHESSFERNGFISGLTTKAGIKNADELMEILKRLFDKYSIFEDYQKLFQKYASKSDIIFLEEKLLKKDIAIFRSYIEAADATFGDNNAKNTEKRFVREISKMISFIEKRKKVHRFPIQVTPPPLY